jgi:hypothetical protein
MNKEDFMVALHKAHVDGNGEAVADIRRKIADGELSTEETLAWAMERQVDHLSRRSLTCKDAER